MSLTKTSAINISKALAVVLIGAVAVSQLNIDFSKYASLVDFGRENPYREVNKLLNGAFYSFLKLEAVSEYLMKNYGPETGYYLVCYVRDLIAGTLVYWLTAGVWHIMIYHVFRKSLFTDKGRPLPTWETIIDQMALAQSSLFVYAALPILSEYFIESGFTRTYFYVSDIGGWKYYFAYLFLYFVFFEVGIYWVHRTLHTNKFLYKYVHGLHHKYNQSLTLTPWASIAFNPIDGILQASPYVVGLFFLPVHYFTHVFLLFFSGVWATNIHDALWGNTEPIMGSKYHTMHHTHYHYNFGQFFIFCDYLWGSLRTPDKTKFD